MVFGKTGLKILCYNKSGIVFGDEFIYSLMETGTKGRDEVMIFRLSETGF